MKLTKKTDYAIRILIYIANNRNEIIQIKTIATNLNISEDYSRKIIQKYNQLDVLKSINGSGGGVTILDYAFKISIKEILIAFEDVTMLENCLTDCSTCCFNNNCKFDKVLLKAQLNFYNTFKDLTITDLI